MATQTEATRGASSRYPDTARALGHSWVDNVKLFLTRRGFLGGLFSATALQAVPGGGGAADDCQGDISSRSGTVRELIELADPTIGGIGHLLTSLDPEVQLPHGMAIIAPVVAPGVTDTFLATRVYGFSIGASILMATDGAGLPRDLGSSEWDHDFDKVLPSDAEYALEDSGIRVAYTVAHHSEHFCFRFPDNKSPRLIVRSVESADYRPIDSKTISGVETRQGVRSYIVVRFSQPASELAPFIPETKNSESPAILPGASSAPSGLILSFPPGATSIQARIGISYIDIDQATRNLEEDIPAWDFEAAKSKSRAVWNENLGKIEVRGGSDEEKTIFYTALYRSMQFMKDVTEQDRYYGPYDHAVHAAEGRRFFIEDNLWDTYRCRHPLQSILEPDVNQDQINSFVRLYEESGWLPQFPFMAGDLLFMNGNHAASMILDSYAKGQRNFDIEKAFEGAKKASLQATMLPYRRGGLTELDRFYAEHGYFPALRKGVKETVPEVHPDMRRQAVSVTLDAAYDDWCLHELARMLGRDSDASFFGRRALNYRNLYNPASGWIEPRDADGQFIPGFDPKWAGGQAGRDYFTECNGWVYQFDVQHDIGGLIKLMGGREKFLDRLDGLFAEGYDGNLKFVFLSQFPDSTALIGQYPQGNEPAFHIPYLYNYAGQPWKTQRRVRRIMQTWYAARPLGLPGDDDNGATTSWYVLSALGFYPVCPGRPLYTIGSPIFEEARIRLENGRTFTVIARGASRQNKYVQSVRINGKPHDLTWFEHAALMAGSTLELEMGPLPNRQWGITPDAAPPSITPR